MYKNCSGFTLVEAIASLSLLLFITAILLPIMTQIMVERENAVLKSQAQQLLNSELSEDAVQQEKTVIVAGMTYSVFWTKEENEMEKVCVQWRDYAGRTVKRCGYAKK
ncbi:competence type IV pilus minor pilin ComGE [Anoxybacteroides tepidamans]|uniref:competence type IV pilus minor pilin ComGE n=1 Tax=Anoxybacteroides tepidamans TaxID=265948 RepID=UPI000480C257|nr:competence type IV pilus minor pilin ComGE [Anoxybacillus tepidamans]